MTKNIYTSVTESFGKIFFRGYKDGKRIQSKLNYGPTFYVPSEAETGIKSLYDVPLQERKFQSIFDAKSWVKENKDSVPIHGNSNYTYAFIHDYFRGEQNVLMDDLKICSVDIETTTHINGFPKVENPLEEILLFTFVDFKTKVTKTFGAKPYNGKYKDVYTYCSTEKELLQSVIEHIRLEDYDIITGWNVQYFDIAYFCSRVSAVLGPEWLAKLSPFNSVTRHIDTINEREQIRYNIVGRTVLDLLDLYKKFRFITRESYKLDFIAEVELGKNKLENPYSTFREHYELGWNHETASFVDYNIIDTLLVDELETKLGLVYIAITIAYLAKINFEDVFSPVKIWESMITHTLHSRNVFVEISARKSGQDTQIMGGYVKDPVKGFYDWLVAFDATALYPCIMMALNISPETFDSMKPDVTVDSFLLGSMTQTDESLTLGANGAQYVKNKSGIIPTLTKQLFDGRKTAKNSMLELKREYQLIAEEMTKRGIKH